MTSKSGDQTQENASAKSFLPQSSSARANRTKLPKKEQEPSRSYSGDLLCVHDLKGRFLSVDPEPARVLGYSVEEVLRIPMRELVQPQLRGQFDEYLKEVETKGEAHGLLVVTTRSGEQRIWEYHNRLRKEGVPEPVVQGIAHDVTDLMRTHHELRAANEELQKAAQEREDVIRKLTLFRTLLDQSHDCIQVIEPETLRLLDLNERTCATLGYSREELLSMTIYDIAPEFKHENREDLLRQLKDSGFAIIERIHRRKDGSTFPVEVTLREVELDRKYGIAVSRDITEKKKSEERQREYERVVEGLDELIVVLDRDYRYVLANRAYLQYRGLRKEQAIGRHLSEVLGSELFDTVAKEKLDECFLGKIVQFERKDNHPEIGERDVSISYFPIEGTSGIDRIAIVIQDLTERKAAEKALREADERAESILNNLNDMYISLDRDWRHVYVNQAAAATVGLTREQVLGRNMWELYPELVGTEMERQARRAMEQRTSVAFDFACPRTGGWANVRLYPSAEGLSVFMTDITERKRAEEALRESEERMRLAQEAAKIGTFERNLQTGEGRWTTLTEAMFGLAPGAGPTSIEAFLDLIHPEDRPRVANLMATSVKTGEAGGEWRVIWPDGSVHWIAGRWRAFNDDQGRPLKAIGIDIDITERKAAEAALHASEERYRSVIAAMAEGVILQTADGKVVDANQSAERILGQTSAELVGQTPTDWQTCTIHEDGSPFLPEDHPSMVTLRTGRPQSNVCMGITHLGNGTRWILMSTQPLWHQGEAKPYAVVTSFTDITDRRRAEEALQVSEERYRSVVSAMAEGVLLRDTEGSILACNQSFEQMVGSPREEIVGTTAAQWEGRTIHEDGSPFLAADHPSIVALRTGKPQSKIEMGVRSPDGNVKWMSINAKPIFRSGQSKPYAVVSTFADVTAQKQAEGALKESELRLRLAIEVAKMGAFDRNLQTGEAFWTPEIAALYGLSPDAAPMSTTALAELVHSDDRAHFSSLTAKSKETGLGEGEWRVVWPDGSVHWISGRWKIFKDDEGRPLRAVGVDFDITDRKRAEEALQKSEAELREAQRVAHMGSWRLDLRTMELHWSEQLYRELGMEPTSSPSTFAGLQPFLTTDGWETVQQSLERIQRTKQTQEIEIGYLLPDGSKGWTLVRAEVELDYAGAVFGLHGIAIDITDRKRAEEALEQSEQRFRVAIKNSPITVFTMDRDLRYTWVYNPLLPHPLSDMLGKDLHEFWGSVGGDELWEIRQRVLETGVGIRHEVRVEYGGEEHFFDATVEPVFDSSGAVIGLTGASMDITERKRAEEVLQRSEALERAHAKELQTILDTLPIPVMIAHDAECRHMTTNQTGRELLKLAEGANLSVSAPPEQMPPYRFVRDGVELSPQELPMQMAAKTGRPVYRVPTELVFDDGTRMYELGNAAPLFDENGKVRGAVGAAIDITESKRAEEALRQSAERFRIALTGSPIKVYNQDLDLRYTWVYNPPDGWTVEDYLGKTDEEVFGPEDGARMRALKQRVLDTGERVWQEFDLTARGHEYYCDITIEPLRDAAGRIVGVNCACVDLTDIHKITEELRQAKEKLTEEKLYLEETINTEMGFEQIIGRSDGLKAVMEQAARVATSDATVLLLGETGVGKELVARAIHRLSLRRSNSFIKMNCAAIPSGLLESELFGAERGAYTGSVARKVGRLELADRGTIFLDEIGEIALGLQPKLLRVLQDQEFERLGGTQTLKVNFRLIAATNRDLAESVHKNEFRRDLYYRLNVFPIVIPPLRERRDDIPLLVEHFVKKCSRRMNKTISSIPKRTMDSLKAWDWPGNVRELENFIERSVILTNGSVLAAPLSELQINRHSHHTETLAAAEREVILRALRESRGKIAGERGAAARLGLKRTTLQSKLKQLGIDPHSPDA